MVNLETVELGVEGDGVDDGGDKIDIKRVTGEGNADTVADSRGDDVGSEGYGEIGTMGPRGR